LMRSEAGLNSYMNMSSDIYKLNNIPMRIIDYAAAHILYNIYKVVSFGFNRRCVKKNCRFTHVLQQSMVFLLRFNRSFES
jgi:hypothetical protein